MISSIPILRNGAMQVVLSINFVKLETSFFQCNVFIFENERQTGFDLNIASQNYLVTPFYMAHLMNVSRTQSKI